MKQKPLLPAGAGTVLLVAHADRGHFAWCVPLARELKKLGLKVELWTNGLCADWGPTAVFDKVDTTSLGDGKALNNVTRLWKEVASTGDSEPEGLRALHANGLVGLVTCLLKAGLGPEIPQLPKQWEQAPFGGDSGLQAFERRVKLPDVAFVCWESLYGYWAGGVAEEARRPHLGFSPWYNPPLRAAYQSEPLLLEDRVERVRNTKDDIIGVSQSKSKYAGKLDCAFIHAELLQGQAKDTGGYRRFGFFLPLDEGDEALDPDLKEWMDRDGKVTVVSLGSQSCLGAVSEWAEADLLKGCLQGSARVLSASSTVPADPVLQKAADDGLLKLSSWLPLWAVLGHKNAACFVSHCGSNSVHESIARGVPIVPLPLFSDQYYLAPIVEELMGYGGEAGYSPLRKATLRASAASGVAAVEAAVRRALAVPEATLKKLKQRIRKEEGAASAAKAVKAQIASSPKIRKPKFGKVSSIAPNGSSNRGINLMLKVVTVTWPEADSSARAVVVAGDESGVVTIMVAGGDGSDKACFPGASVRVQNARVSMTKKEGGSSVSVIRLVVDKWGVVAAADEDLSFEAKTSNDISATEYQVAA